VRDVAILLALVPTLIACVAPRHTPARCAVKLHRVAQESVELAVPSGGVVEVTAAVAATSGYGWTAIMSSSRHVVPLDSSVLASRGSGLGAASTYRARFLVVGGDRSVVTFRMVRPFSPDEAADEFTVVLDSRRGQCR